jgi:hypothetical protein
VNLAGFFHITQRAIRQGIDTVKAHGATAGARVLACDVEHRGRRTD